MKTKRMITCLLLSLVLLLAGCGTKAASEEDLLAGMKEFTLSNGSASLYLDKDWSTQDTGMDNMMIVGTDDGRKNVLMFQCPRDNIYQVENIDDLKSILNNGFQVTDEVSTDTFEIPGMSNISASQCNMVSNGVNGKACLIYGETDYAFYLIGYVGTKFDDSTIASLKVSCSKFSELESVSKKADSIEAEMTDTIRWFNASYAVLTELNGWDYNIFAGLPADAAIQLSVITTLEEWWGVTDRTSADETLDWILQEGHRADFAENMAYMEDCGLGQASDRESFLLGNFELTPDETQLYLNWYEMYEQYGKNAIAGWDYCRALNLLSFYYLAGYYSEQEALDKSLEIAQTVQPLFTSWDDLIASYMRGYEYWAEESSAERQAIYEDLKTRDDNPYQVDFKTELVKTW